MSFFIPYNWLPHNYDLFQSIGSLHHYDVNRKSLASGKTHTFGNRLKAHGRKAYNSIFLRDSV